MIGIRLDVFSYYLVCIGRYNISLVDLWLSYFFSSFFYNNTYCVKKLCSKAVETILAMPLLTAEGEASEPYLPDLLPMSDYRSDYNP